MKIILDTREYPVHQNNEQFTCSTNHPSVKKFIILNFTKNEISIQDNIESSEFKEYIIPYFPNAQLDIHTVDPPTFNYLNNRIKLEEKLSFDWHIRK